MLNQAVRYVTNVIWFWVEAGEEIDQRPANHKESRVRKKVCVSQMASAKLPIILVLEE